MVAISRSLEDYLEAILLVSLEKGVARVKDVAEALGVKKPSVVSAVKTLEKLGLVFHEHYGYLELTKKGLGKAQEIYRRHQILFRFFFKILGVDEKTAEKDACGIEHYISSDSLNRLIKLIEFLEKDDNFALNKLRDFLKEESSQKEEDKMSEKKLTELEVGKKAVIRRILGDPFFKRKLMNMGAIPGTELRLEKVAPLGDPLDIVVKGYHLSLRKEEAENIIVEEC